MKQQTQVKEEMSCDVQSKETVTKVLVGEKKQENGAESAMLSAFHDEKSAISPESGGSAQSSERVLRRNPPSRALSKWQSDMISEDSSELGSHQMPNPPS